MAEICQIKQEKQRYKEWVKEGKYQEFMNNMEKLKEECVEWLNEIHKLKDEIKENKIKHNICNN